MAAASPALSRSVLHASLREWLHVGPQRPGTGPRWLQLAWTAACSVAVAVPLTVLDVSFGARHVADFLDAHRWLRTFAEDQVICLIVALVIHGLFAVAWRAVGAERIAGMRGWTRALLFLSLTLLGVAIGWPLGLLLAFGGDTRIFGHVAPVEYLSVGAISLLIIAAGYVFFALTQRRLQAESRAVEAQLRLLQAQMEPHFLFNSLANVISLIDADPSRARQVLEAFTDYLRASLGSLRRGESTLGAELELAERYLSLMQARMGARLHYEIDADAALREAALPPLLLQPLVENAVRHGLEPQVEGGTVRVRARRLAGGDGMRLRVCVEDDGAGLEAAALRARQPVPGRAPGAGIALANLRERLQAQYGEAAQLTLAPRRDGAGTEACLVIPHRRARAADADAPREGRVPATVRDAPAPGLAPTP
jgi:two-component sensor histidine kinase